MTDLYTIRPAQRSDLDRLVELLLALQDHLEAANPGLWRMTPQARANLKGQIASRLTGGNTCMLVAEHNKDGVIGFISGRIARNKSYEPARAGLVDQAFVRADHRRARVGTRLVTELCRFFAAEGVNDLSLRYVMGNEEATEFWSALGFAPRIVTTGADRQTVEKRLARQEADSSH